MSKRRADDCIASKVQKVEMNPLRPEHLKSYLDAAGARGVLPMFYLDLVSGLWIVYIARHIEHVLEQINTQYPVLLVTGPGRLAKPPCWSIWPKRRAVQESLAGWVALLQLSPLSYGEIVADGDTPPFRVSLSSLRQRQDNSIVPVALI